MTIKIFLASSFELREDREALRSFIATKNDMLHEQGVYLKLVTWEDSNAIVPDGMQSNYNEAIKECDVIFFLFWKKAGKYTLEEFEVAYEYFKRTSKPNIYTYFKDETERTPELIEFQGQLSEELHFYTSYENKHDLCNQIYDQFEKLGYLANSHGRPLPKAPSPPSNFVGRDDLLVEIHDQLERHNRLVLNGLGGIGKTTIAQKYVERYRAEYNTVAWIFIQNGLEQDMVTILQAAMDDIVFPANTPLEDKFEYLMMALGDYYDGNNLLVLDNANDADELLDLVVHLEACGWETLITSRCTPDEEEYQFVQVDELPEDDAIKLFRKHYSLETDVVELRVLLAKIDYHTLLIELVAKAGKKKGLSIGQLLERLDGGLAHEDLQRIITVGKHADTHKVGKKAKLHEYIVAMFEPEDLDEEQQRILRYFSVLPAVDIPLEHLKRLFEVEDENEFEDILDGLLQSGWLGVRDGYWMHSMVQEMLFVKLEVDSDKVGELVAVLSIIMQDHIDIALDFIGYANIVALKLSDANVQVGWLNFYLANSYVKFGLLDSALTKIIDANRHFVQCDDKENLAISYSKLGDIHQALNQIDKAHEFFELCNQLSKELYELNPESESLKKGLVISYDKLGTIHMILGQIDKARPIFEIHNQLSKELYEANLEDDSLKHELAVSYSKLGGIQQVLGNLDKALEFFELNMKLTKELYKSNPENEDFKNGLAASYNWFGNINSQKGMLNDALIHYEVYKNLMFELSNNNPKSEKFKTNLAMSYSKLGTVYQNLDQADKALESFELYNQTNKELYESNPESISLKNELATSCSKLGEIYQVLGNVNKALEYFELYNQISKELYESNPRNIETIKNLAISYRELAIIYQAKTSFHLFVLKHYNQPILELHRKSIDLWQELYQTTLDSDSLEYANKAYLLAKTATYVPIIQLIIILLIGNLYLINWINGWLATGVIVWFWPMRWIKPKKVRLVKILLIGLLGLGWWFF
ncbi:MAG: NB-ARC domain-containing protein [Candidatus Marithrix sp.]